MCKHEAKQRGDRFPEWDGTWLLLLSEGLEKTVLAEVKKQLLWQGFGALAPSLLASPSQKLADVQSLLHEAGVAENVICFEAHSPLALSRAALRDRVEECWHLTEQNEMYEAFIALFRPLLPLLRDSEPSELTPRRRRKNCSMKRAGCLAPMASA